jgi:thioredoxin domain-containing protein 5
MNAKHRPLVVIAAVNKGSKEKVAERMKEIGKVWNVRRMQKQADSEGGREVVFAWMDADKWAKWLKTMYGMEVVSAEEPGIVVADHGVSDR